MSLIISSWIGLFIVLGIVGSGLVLLGLSCALISAVFKKDAAFILIGLMAGFQILVSFTSAKECGIVLGGQEFFIIAGSLIYPILSCGEDYLNEFFGKDVARKSVYAQICTRIVTTLFLTLIIYIPAPIGREENYHSFFNLMNILPRIAVTSIISTYISGILNVFLYAAIKKMTNNRYLWFRSIVSTISSSCINAFIFTFLAFVGLKTVPAMLQMVLLSVIVRLITVLCEVPFLYFMRKIRHFY